MPSTTIRQLLGEALEEPDFASFRHHRNAVAGEQVRNHLAGNDDWDVEEMPVDLNGVRYLVNASFGRSDSAVDHRHDLARGQGQDLLAEIPVSVERIEAYTDEGGQVVDEQLLQQIGAVVLDQFSASPEARRNPRWAEMM